MDKAEPLEPISKKVEKETIEITAQDIDEMESVLEKVATVKQIDIIGDDLNELKEEVIDYKEVIEKNQEILCYFQLLIFSPNIESCSTFFLIKWFLT